MAGVEKSNLRDLVLPCDLDKCEDTPKSHGISVLCFEALVSKDLFSFPSNAPLLALPKAGSVLSPLLPPQPSPAGEALSPGVTVPGTETCLVRMPCASWGRAGTAVRRRMTLRP